MADNDFCGVDNYSVFGGFMFKRFAVILVIIAALVSLAVPVFGLEPGSLFFADIDPDLGTAVFAELPIEGSYTVSCGFYNVNGDIEEGYAFELVLYNLGDYLFSDLDPEVFWAFDLGREFISAYLEISTYDNSVVCYLDDNDEGAVVRFDYLSLEYLGPLPSDPDEPGSDPGIVDSVLEVFSGLGSWISTTLLQFVSLFYSADTGLTILGLICIIPVALSVCFLVFMLIVNIIKFRN